MTKPKSTWISEWNPEDEQFWESTGKFIARRNLFWSILAEHLGFSIWLSFSKNPPHIFSSAAGSSAQKKC